MSRKNARTKDFKQQFRELPEEVQNLARKVFRLFVQNPGHPSLRLHQLHDTYKSKQRKDSYSVSINMRYRALFFLSDDDSTNIWYWIGSHSDYNKYTGKK